MMVVSVVISPLFWIRFIIHNFAVLDLLLLSCLPSVSFLSISFTFHFFTFSFSFRFCLTSFSSFSFFHFLFFLFSFFSFFCFFIITYFFFPGSWTDDKICGEGTSTYPNGNKFVGQWLHGKINGNGESERLCTDSDTEGTNDASTLTRVLTLTLTWPRPWPQPWP